MIGKRVFEVAVLVVAFGSPLHADVYTRVVDVGAGLCCVVVLPDDHYMVYDAGNYEDNGATAIAAIRELIPSGSTIDLLVLSHCDADHLGAVPAICEEYTISRVLRDGFEVDTVRWRNANEAIEREVLEEACVDTNLKHVEVEPGETFQLGEVNVTFVCGFHDLPDDWPALSPSEARNARSVVVRLDYAGQSMLFTGDTVGRHNDDDDDVCIAAERFMVDNADQVPIASSVIIAPHHGADNGSSTAFIQAVNPEYVIFSAGSKHEHPTKATAERYLAAGVDFDKIFRTDFDDNEGGKEWMSVSGNERDRKGDDDVEILIAADGPIQVNYLRRFFAAPMMAEPEPGLVDRIPAPAVVACPGSVVRRCGSPPQRPFRLFRRCWRR